MARKPAQTKAEDKTTATATAVEEKPVPVTGAPEADAATDATGATDNADDRGTATAGTAADAPDQDPAADAPGQTGGEVAEDLPATSPEASELTDAVPVQTLAVATAENAEEPDELADADFIVVCHRKGGRRRAGRRWPEGRTPIRRGDLSAFEMVQLQGDPQFTVAPIVRI